MKKIFYFIIFSFCCAQAQSQMYIVTVSEMDYGHPMKNTLSEGDYGVPISKCDTSTYENRLHHIPRINYKVITIIDPQGNVTYECYNASTGNIKKGGSSVALLNRIFNKILKQGYKLVSKEGVLENGTWYFALP